jgi:mono/diheme cytochrome c family protein
MFKIFASLPLVMISLGMLCGCTSAETSTPATNLDRPDPPAEYSGLTNPVAGKSEAAQAGSEVYRIYCVICHGESGKGDGPAAASLKPKPRSLAANQAALSDAYLYWRISEGGSKKPFMSAMPAWKTILSEEEIWEIITFLRTLKN